MGKPRYNPLKSAITRPCRYESGVNRSYEDLAAHYGSAINNFL